LSNDKRKELVTAIDRLRRAELALAQSRVLVVVADMSFGV
jgi:hypothetical protein